jgi:hypothetical protein
MMRRPLDIDLGELNQTCSTLLFQSFHKAGISPIWANAQGGPKGGAVFFYYDGHSTCLRVLPRSPKFFHGSLRGNLFSHADATTLSHALIRTLKSIRRGYSDFFAPELNSGPVGLILKDTLKPGDFDFAEIHTSLAPDELYASLPWPFIPQVHFPLGQFTSAGMRAPYSGSAAQEPLRAINSAVELVALGACLDLTVDDTLLILDWLEALSQGQTDRPLPRYSENISRAIIPCFAGGFQGLVFAFFQNLPTQLEAFALGQLQHFAATLGQGIGAYRQRRFNQATNAASSLTDYLHALIAICPPMDHIVCVNGKERVGVRLQREGSYLAGYRLLHDKALTEAFEAPDNEWLTGEDESGIKALIKLPGDIPALHPAFTLLRLRPVVSQAPFEIKPATGVLTRTELGALRHQLRGQVHHDRGALAAARRLFAVDQVLKNYEQGEVILSNAKARAYLADTLGRDVSGYHVAGKAAAKFIADAQKMLPNKLSFDAPSAHGIRVRWRPEHHPPLKSEQFQSTDG